MAKFTKFWNGLKHKSSTEYHKTKNSAEDVVKGDPSMLKQAKRGFKNVSHKASYLKNQVLETAREALQEEGIIKKPWYEKAWDAVVAFVKEFFGSEKGEYDLGNDEQSKKSTVLKSDSTKEQKTNEIRKKYGLSNSEPDLSKVGVKSEEQSKGGHKRSRSAGDVGKGGHEHSQEYNRVKAKHQKQNTVAENSATKPADSNPMSGLLGKAQVFRQSAQDLSLIHI